MKSDTIWIQSIGGKEYNYTEYYIHIRKNKHCSWKLIAKSFDYNFAKRVGKIGRDELLEKK